MSSHCSSCSLWNIKYKQTGDVIKFAQQLVSHVKVLLELIINKQAAGLAGYKTAKAIETETLCTNNFYKISFFGSL